MSEQHQQPLVKILKSETPLPSFSLQKLFFPESKVSFGGLTCPGEFKIPSFHWLPFRIEFPIERDPYSGKCKPGGQFSSYARKALLLEKRIFNEILDARDQMTPQLAEIFQIELVQLPVVEHLLRRIEGLRSEKRQLVPGVYLGCVSPDFGIGGTLQSQLSQAWKRVGKELPKDICLLAEEWGHVQRQARQAIAAASWATLVSRGSWSPPAGFEKHLASFLEGRIPPIISEEFWSWFSQIDKLAESTESKTLRLVTAIRAWDPSQGRPMPEEIIEEFHSSSEPFTTWQEYLRHPQSVNERILAEELFPDENSRPVHVRFRKGVPHHLVITEQQAVDFGCTYMKDFDPQEFTILYSSDPLESSWLKLARAPELCAIAKSPIMPFITNIEVDCQNLAREEVTGIFREQMQFLRTVELNDTWRIAESPLSLTLSFKNLDQQTLALLMLNSADSSESLPSWTVDSPIPEPSFGGRLSLKIPCTLEPEVSGD